MRWSDIRAFERNRVACMVANFQQICTNLLVGRNVCIELHSMTGLIQKECDRCLQLGAPVEQVAPEDFILLTLTACCKARVIKHEQLRTGLSFRKWNWFQKPGIVQLKLVVRVHWTARESATNRKRLRAHLRRTFNQEVLVAGLQLPKLLK